ncbi:MAG TPA: hypothetical protein VF120_18290 [Ktedonobacterales bacterium]
MARGVGAVGGIDENFDGSTLDPHWTPVSIGGGINEVTGSVLRMALPFGNAGAYSDAQIDDYDDKMRAHFQWRPPLRIEVRARTSLPASSASPASAGTSATPPTSDEPGEPQRYLRGTFGFGLWNYPFSLKQRAIRMPNAVWFFGASPPSNMALVPGVPGYGWKAQVVHANRLGALACAIPTTLAVLWARITGRGALAARWVQRFSGTSERILDANINEWHIYTLDWLPHVARFAVDGEEALRVMNPPRGPLGFVAWIDNQYAVATPRGAFRFGTLATGPEALELDWLRIIPGG